MQLTNHGIYSFTAGWWKTAALCLPAAVAIACGGSETAVNAADGDEDAAEGGVAHVFTEAELGVEL
jgi:hypothetical protein